MPGDLAGTLLKLLFWLVVLLATLTAVASFTWPLGWDQGIFAWVGDVIIRGGLPYRDGWDIKGPVPYYTYAFAQWLFGRNAWSIRIVDLILLVSSCVLLYRALVPWSNRIVARWGALLFGMWYASGSYWHTAQPDGWVAMMMIAVFALIMQPGRQAGWITWFVVGILIGFASLVKILYVLFLLVPAALIIGSLSESGSFLRRALAIITGFLAPFLLTAFWFWMHDAWDDLLEATFVYPAEAYTALVKQDMESRVRGLIEFVTGGIGTSVALPFVLLGLYGTWTKSRQLGIVVTVWGVAAIAVVIIQNRFFTYHWIVVFPVVVILSAIGIYSLLHPAGEPKRNMGGLLQPGGVLAGSALLVFVLHVTALPAVEVAHWASYLTGHTTARGYAKHFGSPADDIAAAEFVRESVAEDQTVVIFGWNSSVLFLSGRISPTRFGFSMPLMQGTVESERFRNYRQEFMDAIRVNSPAAIVVGTQAEALLGGTYSIADFPEFQEYVQKNYKVVRQFGDLSLYTRQVMNP